MVEIRGRRRQWQELIRRTTILLWISPLCDAKAAHSIEDACGSVDFTANQEKHYSKSEFIEHAAVAETMGSIISVFYDQGTESWSIEPADLKDIVLKNINRIEGTKIYGSAIAFEPDVWSHTEGLKEGVPFPAMSDACLDISTEYCEHPGEDLSGARIDSLHLNVQNETIYCPYAYQGSPFDMAFTNCSAATPHFCPTMDLSRAYDYSDTNNPDVEWYTAPRCLFFKDGTTDGYWTSPYFDAGAGNINMVTYAQPIIAGSKFLGIATIDIEVEALCFGNQCVDACPAEDYNYTVSECNTNGERSITYTSSDPTCPIDPTAQGSTLSCSYVPAASAIGISLIVVGVSGAIVCLAVLILLIAKRNSAIIRASQLNISYGFIASGVLANVSTFAYVGDQTRNCGFAFWAAILPVTMQLAFLFGKIYRTYKLFLWARQFKRKNLTDSELLCKIAAVILVQVGLLVLWTLAEDPTPQEVPLEGETVDKRYCVGEECHPTEWVCAKRYNFFGYLPVMLLAVLIIAGCVLTFQSRALPNCFCEAKYVMFAMYTVALVYAIAIMVVLVGGKELPASVETLLLTVATCTTATWSVLVIFVPKFLKLWTLNESDMQRELRSKVRQTNSRADSRAGSQANSSFERPDLVERKNSYEYDWQSVGSAGSGNDSSRNGRSVRKSKSPQDWNDSSRRGQGTRTSKSPQDWKSDPTRLECYGSPPSFEDLTANNPHDWRNEPAGLASNGSNVGNTDTQQNTSDDWINKPKLEDLQPENNSQLQHQNKHKCADHGREVSVPIWADEPRNDGSVGVRLTVGSGDNSEHTGPMNASSQRSPAFGLRRRSV